MTPFDFNNISVPYKGVDQTFAMPHHPLWNWAVDLILDPQLALHFEWDAQKVFKHNGENVTHMFWNFQSQIPEDKVKLSSFGTEMAYLVVACCTNLPTEIRNGHGVGGGRVVGWLPNIPETLEDSKKPAFINFKCKVWHCAFCCIIESIIEKSKVGCWLHIIILSTDYEEQCVMSLIWGYLGKLPCSICCIPKDQLADNSKTWPLRTAAHVKQILREVQALSKSDCESHLSKHGICDVNNVFWLVNNSDPHHALSFDRLYSNNAGLFRHHLWQRFKDLVSQNHDAAVKVETVSFTDGTKFEDISKVVVFAAQNIIQRSEDKEGWQLLLCLQSFSVLDLLLSFKVHTEKTIMAGWNELARFRCLIKAYIELSMALLEATANKVRDWNYPKMHVLVHSFDDIKVKGASRNYNTKLNEKLHGPIRKLYNRTNFKNVVSQILNQEHLGFIAALIRNQINELDLDAAAHELGSTQAQHIGSSLEPLAHNSSSYQKRNMTFDAGVVILRSQQCPVTLEAVGDLEAQNPTFKNFHMNLMDWLTANLPLYGFSFASGSMRVEFQADDQLQSVNTQFAWQSTEFFFAQSIVCGAPLIQDFAKLGDYFVMDVVDHTGDLFLCCDEIFGW
ncbi:hypothetical protein BJY52DRAFT_1229255 [Lactarius psammicola]|nr:hypothetical protein BJY52DRAFT_1229255 [Lactarius psammicola]